MFAGDNALDFDGNTIAIGNVDCFYPKKASDEYLRKESYAFAYSWDGSSATMLAQIRTPGNGGIDASEGTA